MREKKRKSVIIKIYGPCNFKCRICMASSFTFKSDIPALDNVKTQILKAKEKGVEELDFSGTEPTLYPYLHESLRFGYEQGMHCCVCTNGYAFASKDFARQFKGYQPFGIKVTFHSHRREVFDDTTQIRGSYEAVLKAMDNIQEELNVYPKSKHSYLLASVVITNSNYKDLSRIVSFLYDRGVQVVKLSYLDLSGRVYSNPSLLVAPDKIHGYFVEAVNFMKTKKMFYYFNKIPVCFFEKEHRHFIPKINENSYYKLKQCSQCQYDDKCCGISKLSMIAHYGQSILTSRDLFPKDFFDRFLTDKDVHFIKRMSFSKIRNV